jgi:glycosyltransferase involved in cell wall biosynthesis
MSKRIIISATNDLSTDQRLHRFATTLHAAGWEVVLVGRRLPSSLPIGHRPYSVRRLKVPFVSGPLFYASFNVRLFFHLLFSKAHTFLSTDMDTLPANWLAARLRGKTLIYDSHEYWTELPELIGRKRVRAVWLWLERRLFPRVDKAMTVNPSIAKIYSEKYHLQVKSVQNLPLRQPEIPHRSRSGHVLIYQGALNMGRGLEMMVDAMAHLPPHYRLQIAGSGPLADPLKAKIASTGLGERIEVLGHVNFAELPIITQKAALGMSLEEDMGMSYRLASPNKLFDYVQAGVPVLASDLPEMCALVDKYKVGKLLNASDRNPAALAEKIKGIVEDERLWKEFHRNALAAAQVLCWEMEQQKLLEVTGLP